MDDSGSFSEPSDYTEVTGTRKVLGEQRWARLYEAVFKHSPSGKYYTIKWTEGTAKEQEVREDQMFEYQGPGLIEVELITNKWVPV